ncbi:hypothetical protein D3C86_2214560 [compost metagenome]
MGFEVFGGQPQIQNRLGTGADHRDIGACQLLQIRRDIKRVFCAAVHAADATGGKDVNARHLGNNHG